MWKWIYPGKEGYLYICEITENKDWWRKWDVFTDRWSFVLMLWNNLAEKQWSEITTICIKMTFSEMTRNPNLSSHQPCDVLHSYEVISGHSGDDPWDILGHDARLVDFCCQFLARDPQGKTHRNFIKGITLHFLFLLLDLKTCVINQLLTILEKVFWNQS